MSVKYFSPQLADILAQVLLGAMKDFLQAGFLLLSEHGQMMAYTGESLARLETSLAGNAPESLGTVQAGP